MSNIKAVISLTFHIHGNKKQKILDLKDFLLFIV